MTTAVTPEPKEEPKAPTEAEVNARNEAEKAKWQPDFKEEDLKIPSKPEDVKDDTTKGDEAKTNKLEEDGKGDEGDDSSDSEETQPTYSEPAPVVTVEDPGEYKPADYSFEIEIDGKKHKVETADQADELADEFAEKLTAKQLGQLIREGAKIESKQERDKLEWQKNKDEYEKQATEQAGRMEYVNQIDKEVKYLVDTGALPKITDPAVKQRWETDPKASEDKEFIKNPGIKEQIELLHALAQERERRQKAGLSTNVSAIDVMRDLQSKKQKVEEKEHEAGEQRKVASSKVAGVASGAQGQYVPDGIAVGRVIDMRNTGWS